MLTTAILSVAIAVASMTNEVFARPGLGVVHAMSHLSAREANDLILSHHHQSFARLRKRAGGSVKGSPRRLARRGAVAEATLQCRGAYAFALCDGDHCTDMGSVAGESRNSGVPSPPDCDATRRVLENILSRPDTFGDSHSWNYVQG